ncbi:polyserase-2-like isoform X2 [Anopheles funestus]|uniref:polyserase-2-like precursor n=1 Tax=Anopheles funestus TaxID=62324 RepID=UPI0020C630A2|nr:polyserase-2-like precursor [Anopheles funestus]XP_049299922.1 polyserase-2-like isoform X2 [Anopheles funestus]
MVHQKQHWWTARLFVIVLLHTICSSFAQDELQTKDYNDNECGKRLAQREGLVKGGYSTRPGDWPWHVALYQRGITSDGFEYACGGSIVHRYLILSAAHCVTFAASRRKIPTENLLLKMGRFNLSNEIEEHAEEFNVIETVVHVGFRPTTFENDIAILRVQIPIIFNDYIQPVCLWKRDDGFELPYVYNEQAGTVVGWGLAEENRLGAILNEARMPVVDSLTCLASDRAFFGRLLSSKAYCAGYKNGTGVCNGDSGGGMFFQFQNRWYLKGVVSFSNTIDSSGLCNLKQYIGFTDAAQYIDWLYENTPNSGIDDPILGHPNIRLINQGNCGRNEHVYEYGEERKPIFKQYPWMVAIRHPFVDSEYVPCNGVLLNRNYVLTTTCVDLQDEISVTLGDYDTSKTKDCGTIDGQEQCVSSVQTVSVGQLFRKDNLVLARLTIPAVIGRRDHIEAICLPVTPQQRGRLYNRYIMTGWKESGTDSRILQRALLEAIDLNKCRAEFQGVSYASEASKQMDNRTICARNLDDPSRSPRCNDYQPGSAIQAIEKKSNRYLLYGLQTGISYCSVPEQYIAISKYLQWILDNIRG